MKKQKEFKQQIKSGFLLLELLLTQMLWAIIILQSSKILLVIYRQSQCIQNKTTKISGLYCNCQNFINELKYAPRNPKNWIKNSNTYLKWTDRNKKRIKFYLHNKNLIKEIKNPGKKAKKILLIQEIKNLKFKCIKKNQNLLGIKVEILIKPEKLEFFVHFRG